MALAPVNIPRIHDADEDSMIYEVRVPAPRPNGVFVQRHLIIMLVDPPPKAVVHTNNCRACDVNVEFGLPVIPFDLLN